MAEEEAVMGCAWLDDGQIESDERSKSNGKLTRPCLLRWMNSILAL